jgi:phage shock protein E
MKIFIDVREPNEYNQGHVEGALNIPCSSLAKDLSFHNIPLDTELVVYCLSGRRSEIAICALGKLGYAKLTNGINMKTVLAKYL